MPVNKLKTSTSSKSDILNAGVDLQDSRSQAVSTMQDLITNLSAPELQLRVGSIDICICRFYTN